MSYSDEIEDTPATPTGRAIELLQQRERLAERAMQLRTQVERAEKELADATNKLGEALLAANPFPKGSRFRIEDTAPEIRSEPDWPMQETRGR